MVTCVNLFRDCMIVGAMWAVSGQCDERKWSM